VLAWTTRIGGQTLEKDEHVFDLALKAMMNEAVRLMGLRKVGGDGQW
jgi:hypothetical protein